MNNARKFPPKKYSEVERTYTCQQAAAILGLPYATILALCDSDLLGHRVIHPRTGHYSLLVITKAQLDEFIERTNSVKFD